MNDSLISYRKKMGSDDDFIFTTWKLGLKHGSELFEAMDSGAYFNIYGKMIEQLLRKSEVTVACLQEDENVILGYVVIEHDTLHWAFTKPAWRKMGIINNLLKPVGELKVMTHFTNIGNNIFKKKYPKIIFNPFKL